MHKKVISWRSLALTVLLLAVVALSAFGTSTVPSLSASSSPPRNITDPRVLALTKGMPFLTNVPATIPASGVALEDGYIILRLLTANQQAQVTLSSTGAISAAKLYAPTGSTIVPMLVSFTSVGTLPVPGDKDRVKNPIQDVPAWLVVFTSPAPLDMPGGPYVPGQSSRPSQMFYHANIAINAHTGAFVLGFYTP